MSVNCIRRAIALEALYVPQWIHQGANGNETVVFVDEIKLVVATPHTRYLAWKMGEIVFFLSAAIDEK